MYSDLLTQRDVVADAINEHHAGDFGISYRTRRLIYRPAMITESSPKPPRASVIVMGLGYSENALTRATKSTSIAIQVVVEAMYHNDEDLDKYIVLTESIMSVCSSLVAWTENRSSIDEHGMPYQLHNLREQSIYQGIFDAVYQIQRRRSL